MQHNKTRKLPKKQERAQMNRYERRSTLFARRIIVPMPGWAVCIMSGAVFFGLMSSPLVATNIVSLACAAGCVVLLAVSRRQVRGLRWELHEAISNINNDATDTNIVTNTLVDYEPDPEKIHLKKVNGRASSRVSE